MKQKLPEPFVDELSIAFAEWRAARVDFENASREQIKATHITNNAQQVERDRYARVMEILNRGPQSS